MSYPYVTRAIKNPQTKELGYYVQAAPQRSVDLDTLANRVEKRSTVSLPDVKAVLAALEFEIIEALKDGRTVRLGDLGSFYTRLKSDRAATQEECWELGASLVKHVTMCFQRSRKISDELRPARLGLYASDAEEERKVAAGFKKG
ncbi:MAG: HU family DNA-binding protein [Alloprevotella sp.]|nr:HU family DNA-binding protein [Alloprevotella sp.]